MKQTLTRLLVGAVVAVAGLAVADALRSGGDENHSPIRAARTDTSLAYVAPRSPYPPCTTDQLVLRIAGRSSAPAVALRHAGGPTCRVRRLHISVTVRDAQGGDALARLGGEIGRVPTSFLEGNSRPGGVLTAAETPLAFICLYARGRERFTVRVRAGPFVARRTVRCPRSPRAPG